MLITQISVFIENQPGKLGEVTQVLADNGVDMSALSLADTTDFGILRLIVDKPDEAEAALKAAGLTVSLTNVIAIGIPDQPGGFAAAMKALSDAGVGIEYMYAFISRDEGRACVILRVENNDAAIRALRDGGIELLTSERIYTM